MCPIYPRPVAGSNPERSEFFLKVIGIKLFQYKLPSPTRPFSHISRSASTEKRVVPRAEDGFSAGNSPDPRLALSGLQAASSLVPL